MCVVELSWIICRTQSADGCSVCWSIGHLCWHTQPKLFPRCSSLPLLPASLGMWPYSARDFCFAKRWLLSLEGPDAGTLYMVVTSVKDSRYPPQKGLVRADCIASGYVLRPMLRGAKTEGTYFANVNPGKLPSFARAIINKQQPMVVNGLRKVVMGIEPDIVARYRRERVRAAKFGGPIYQLEPKNYMSDKYIQLWYEVFQFYDKLVSSQ